MDTEARIVGRSLEVGSLVEVLGLHAGTFEAGRAGEAPRVGHDRILETADR
jgi:hypothetical protein